MVIILVFADILRTLVPILSAMYWLPEVSNATPKGLFMNDPEARLPSPV